MSRADDEVAIRALAQYFSDAVSRRDYAAMASVYAPDGVFVVPTGAEFKGTELIAKVYRRLVEVDREFLVQMTQSGIVAIDGDRATARWWFTEIKRHTGESFYRYVIGTYQDEVVRLDIGWRFARRVPSGIFEWQLPIDGDAHAATLPSFLAIDALTNQSQRP